VSLWKRQEIQEVLWRVETEIKETKAPGIPAPYLPESVLPELSALPFFEVLIEILFPCMIPAVLVQLAK
jgi:hypothetical protein